MKNSLFLTVVLGLFVVSTAFALEPGDTLWTRTYGGSNFDRGCSVQQTDDGGYIIAGHTESFGSGREDSYLVKTDANGDTLWTRTYGGSSSDYCYSVQQTRDRGYIMAGITESFGAGGYDVYLVKTDADGDTLWTRTYGGSDYDYGMSVQQTNDGGYIIAGYTGHYEFPNPVSYYCYVVKTDENGDTLWTRYYGGDRNDAAYYIQQTSDGGYIMTGYTWSFGSGSSDIYLVKTDGNGNQLWQRAYGGGDREYAYCVKQTDDGGYIIAGNNKSFNPGNKEVWLLKTDQNGDTLWTRTYGGSDIDGGYSVEQTEDGGYIVVGYTYSFGAGNEDLYLIKTDSEGNSLWTRVYGGTSYDRGSSVQRSQEGGYIVAGRTDSFGAGTMDVWLLRFVGASMSPPSNDNCETAEAIGQVENYPFSTVFATPSGYGTCMYSPDIWYVYTAEFSGLTVVSLCGSEYDTKLAVYDGNSCDPLSPEIECNDNFCGLQSQITWMAVEGNEYLIQVGGYSDNVGNGVLSIGPPSSNVSIGIIPENPPVQVPPGGSFSFTYILQNNTSQQQIVDVWTKVRLPSGVMHSLKKRFRNIPLEPNQTITEPGIIQYVHRRAPLGSYDYISYCGDFPKTKIDSSSFEFTVVPSTGGEAGSWSLSGWLGSESEALPSVHALHGNYPNPFNAITVIEYQLPVTSVVKLEIYNLLGNKVATLVDSEQEAGYKSVTWDASEVSSGVYFYKLTAGDFSEVKRMTLLR